MKPVTFKEFKENESKIIEQHEQHDDLTPEQELILKEQLALFRSMHEAGATPEELYEKFTNEGVLGSIFGGLAGFALGKRVGETLASVLGVEKGVLYDLLTSRLVGAALGSSLGKRL